MSGNFIDKYPYTDFHELNLDWIIKTVKDSEKKIDDFTVFNTLTWAGEWEASKSYAKWSIVQDTDGNGYISVQPVPTNTSLSNSNYWIQIAKYETLYNSFNARISEIEKSITYNKNAVKIDFLGTQQEECFSGTILSNNGKAVLIDAGYNSDYKRIVKFINDNNLTLVAFILTHYDVDHIGGNHAYGLDYILKNVDTKNTVAFLPHHNLSLSVLSDDGKLTIQGNMEDVDRVLSDNHADIVYPEEGDKIKLLNGEFTFSNLSIEKFNSISTAPFYTIYGELQDFPSYNDFSMIVTFSIFGRCAVFPGDIQYKAASINCNAVENADIYLVEHHSNNTVMPQNFLNSLHPSISYTYNNTEWDGIYYSRATISALTNSGCLLLNSKYNGHSSILVNNYGISTDSESFESVMATTQNHDYGNGILAGSDADTFTTPGIYTTKSLQEVINLPDVLKTLNINRARIENSLGETGTRSIEQTIKMYYAPYLECSRYRSGLTWTDPRYSVKSKFIYERIKREDTRWLITPSATNYSEPNTTVTCINGIFIFNAILQFDEDMKAATDFFNTEIPNIPFGGISICYGVGIMMALDGQSTQPIRSRLVDSNINIYSSVSIKAHTNYVIHFIMPYWW